jgi:hypothetical protein
MCLRFGWLSKKQVIPARNRQHATSDGMRLLFASADKIARIWKVPPTREQLAASAL